MANGRDFSYCGINISAYGVHYAPERNDWHIWGNDYKVIEKTVDSQDGGQWYGSTIQPKQFALRCYFEEITEYQMASVMNLFKKDANGYLIFDERPWLSYVATVTKPPVLVKYPSVNGSYSGTVVFNLTAYYPYARSSVNTLDAAYLNADINAQITRLLATTALLEEAELPANITISEAAPRTAQFSYYAFNAGDAEAYTTINIAGDVGDGVIIWNTMTNQICKVIGLTDANTTALGGYLTMDSWTGECYMTGYNNTLSGYCYHDNGYINLAPSAPILRDVAFYWNGNESMTSEVDLFDASMTGKYVLIDGQWREMFGAITPREMWGDMTGGTPGDVVSDFITLNRIIVTPVSTMSLTKFEVSYSHTFY